MSRDRLFVCSGARAEGVVAAWKERHRVILNSIGPNSNVNIRLEDVSRTFQHNIPARLMDFLEIASYVFTADCSTERGKWKDDQAEEPWERDLAFHVAVRDPEFWSDPRITTLMQEVLEFLSDDRYLFHFVPLEKDRAAQTPYFENLTQGDWPFDKPDRVLMFSGGLDSLAGAVETASSGKNAVLVSHRAVSTLDARQNRVFGALRSRFPGRLIRVPVWINKSEGFNREPTQRTRSFLFAAVGTLVAQSLDAGGIRFYENGVLSVNLPLAEEALRARASRTTHPLALHKLSALVSAIARRDLAIDNPYLFNTKTEVVQVLSQHKAIDMIRLTCSCSHLMFQSSEKRHCGLCSQCIDRRFAMAGADLLSQDPEIDYVNDVFTGKRLKPAEQSIAVDYVRHGIELDAKSEREIAATFNTEISRAVRYEANRRKAAESLILMHKRHGRIVREVLEDQVRLNASKLIGRTLENTSLLARAIGQDYLARDIDTPESFAQMQHSIKTMLDEILKNQKPDSSREVKVKTTVVKKRDAILFAAILSGLKGLKYCTYLDNWRVKPKWIDDGPSTYKESYLRNGSFRKRVQDEKSRAGQRMKQRSDPELMNAFIAHVPKEFDALNGKLDSRNSRAASKK